MVITSLLLVDKQEPAQLVLLPEMLLIALQEKLLALLQQLHALNALLLFLLLQVPAHHAQPVLLTVQLLIMYAKQKALHLLPIVPHVQQQQLEYSINQIVQDTQPVMFVLLELQPLQFVLNVMLDITQMVVHA